MTRMRMNAENEEILALSFPMLYTFVNDKRDDNNAQIASEGFMCGDGWFDILFMLSAALEKINASYDNTEKMHAIKAGENEGRLSFSLDMMSPEVDNLIYMSQMLSLRLCECCGMKGKSFVNDANIRKTLCDNHSEEMNFTIQCDTPDF